MREDNYLAKLLMFCASRYITYNRTWTERVRIMKSGDGAARFNVLAMLKKLVAEYYNDEIVPTLFEYEFLK